MPHTVRWGLESPVPGDSDVDQEDQARLPSAQGAGVSPAARGLPEPLSTTLRNGGTQSRPRPQETPCCPPSGPMWPQEPKATLGPALSPVTTAFPPSSLVFVHSGGSSGMFLRNAPQASPHPLTKARMAREQTRQMLSSGTGNSGLTDTRSRGQLSGAF